MTKKENIDYWLKTAEHDLEAAEGLFTIAHYDWCLFLGHLVLEKILKAHYVNLTEKVPPKIHDLNRLSELAGLKLNESQLDILERANNFNLASRYLDEKLSFYQTCTKEYTQKNFLEIKSIFEWLKSNLKY